MNNVKSKDFFKNINTDDVDYIDKPDKLTKKRFKEINKEIQEEWHIHNKTSIVRIDTPWEFEIGKVIYKLYEIDEGRADHDTIIISKSDVFYVIIDKDKQIIRYSELKVHNIRSIEKLIKVSEKENWSFIEVG